MTLPQGSENDFSIDPLRRACLRQALRKKSLLLAGRSRHGIIGGEGFTQLAHEAQPAAAHDLVRELQQRVSGIEPTHAPGTGACPALPVLDAR